MDNVIVRFHIDALNIKVSVIDYYTRRDVYAEYKVTCTKQGKGNLNLEEYIDYILERIHNKNSYNIVGFEHVIDKYITKRQISAINHLKELNIIQLIN